jgi:hypothetical protein
MIFMLARGYSKEFAFLGGLEKSKMGERGGARGSAARRGGGERARSMEERGKGEERGLVRPHWLA